MPRPTAKDIRHAASMLRQGRLVVFPTETVYGLGANALDAEAVKRIFLAKGRPADNPIIVHVASTAAARSLAAEWPPAAQLLAEAFWPGPLTLVVRKADHVPDVTTGGLDSIAVRVPGHPVALALLRGAGVPVAAPSANRSGRPSPTRVEHARADLGDVASYLDGGRTDRGLESTVVDVRGGPAILRVGVLARHAVEAVVGRLTSGDEARSPGTRYRHYAPRAKLFVVPRDGVAAEAERLDAAAIVSAPLGLADEHVVGTDPDTWARELFGLLRLLEDRPAIVVEEPPRDGVGEAVWDRLRRAASS